MRRWAFVAVGAAIMGGAGTYQFVWSSLSAAVGTRISASTTALGTVFTLFVITQTLVQLPAGSVRDRYGPRKLLVAAAALMTAGYVGLGVAPTLPVAYASYAIGGAGAGIAYTVAVNTPVKWFDEYRGLATGIVSMAYGGVSFVVIPLVRGSIDAAFTRTLLVLGVAVGVVSLLAAGLLRDPTSVSDPAAGVDAETAADLFCDRYGVASGGNFEGGTTVLTAATSYATLAESYDLSTETVERALMAARSRAFEARAERPRPARDEKVLAGWNGLAISAVAAGARVLDPALAGTATDALAFVREHLWDADAKCLSRRYKDGDVAVEGYLDDYAFLAKGAFDCYQVTGEVDHLAFALELARVVRAAFWDADAGTLYYTPADGEGLVTRPQELNDQSTPSSLGVAAALFEQLDPFAPEEDFAAITERLLSTHADRIRGSPLEHASLVLAADAHARGPVELTLAADDLPTEWRETLAETPLPTGVIAPRPADDDALDDWLATLGLDEAPPIWANRDAVDGEPTAYACRDFTCSPPKTDLDAALSWLD